jgi:hypothetical protein
VQVEPLAHKGAACLALPHDAGPSRRDGGAAQARALSQITYGTDYAKGVKIAGYFRMWTRSLQAVAGPLSAGPTLAALPNCSRIGSGLSPLVLTV